jgi:hypothetical protein
MNKLKSAITSLIIITTLFFTTMYPTSDFNIIPYEIHVETFINKIIGENVFIISFDIGICLLLGVGIYWILKKLVFKK